MILSKDERFTYGRQLTIWLPKIQDLTFALENFVDAKAANCVVRKSTEGYAVFVKPIVADEVDAMMLSKERQIHEQTTTVVDYLGEYADELLRDVK